MTDCGCSVWIPWRPMPDPDDSRGLLCVVSEDVPLSQWGIAAVLPMGFASDGMSVPRLFWRLIGPKVEARTIGPAIVHDWLYLSHVMTRRQADRWLACALWLNGCGWWTCALVYAGVRVGGIFHW